MRITTVGAGFTGNAMFDLVLLGAAAGAGIQILVSVLAGRVPGTEIFFATGVGAILGAMFHIFRSGMF